jgi:thymidylate synthase
MNKADQYYLANLKQILSEQNLDVNPRPKYKDGTPAHSYFISQIFEKYDLSKNEFPITTLRNTAIKTGIKEIMWIYSKQSNCLQDAHDLDISWWDEWEVNDSMTIGQRYGATVKRWKLIDKLLKGLEENPFGRRHQMNLLQESDLEETDGLYPCAFGTIWTCKKDSNGDIILDMTLLQRSQDAIMATYINKTQYVALQMMVAKHLGYKLGTFCHFVQNYHIYDRHLDACNELLNKVPLNEQPTMVLNIPDKTNFYDIKVSDFQINIPKGITKLESDLEIAI